MPVPHSGRRCANPSACPPWCSAPAIWGSARSPTAVQFPLWAALLSTATIFALPGQLAMLEMSIAGSVPVMIVITVALTAARFLPMTVALLPMLRSPGRPGWRIYAAVHLLAMTGWAASMRRCPELPYEQRLPWFVGFALTNWVACVASTAVGYGLAESLPPLVRQGLVFVGPLYFVLILTGETRTRHGVRGARLRRGSGSAGLPRGAAVERDAGRADRRHAGLGTGPTEQACLSLRSSSWLAVWRPTCGAAWACWSPAGCAWTGSSSSGRAAWPMR